MRALKISKIDMDDNFDGDYPKLCVTLEKTVGISLAEELKSYFNFALNANRNPQYTMFINSNNECTISRDTKKILQSNSCKAGSKRRRRRRRQVGGSGKACSSFQTRKNPQIETQVHTIGMLHKKSFYPINCFIYVLIQ